jgi:hypothetical protein
MTPFSSLSEGLSSALLRSLFYPQKQGGFDGRLHIISAMKKEAKKEAISIEGKEWISTSRASEIAGYSRDYVAQLCRQGKIRSLMSERAWWVDESSLRKHAAEAVKANQTSFRPAGYPLFLADAPAASFAPQAPAAQGFSSAALRGVVALSLVALAITATIGSVSVWRMASLHGVPASAGAASAMSSAWQRIA